MKHKTKITLQDYVIKDFPDDVYESLDSLEIIDSTPDETILLVHDTEFNAYGVLNEQHGKVDYGQSLDHAIRLYNSEVKSNINL